MKTIYINGSVFTGALPLVQAFAVEDGHFTAVGSDEEILAAKAENDTVVDLRGAFVCPGFNDSHMHLLNYGFAMECCDLMPHTSSLRELLEELRRFTSKHAFAAGGWIRGRGFNQDYFTDSDHMPTRWELDTVTTEYPVCIVRCCGHCLSVNSKALELLGIDGSTEQPDGGCYDVDENGVPTGVFRDNAMGIIYSRMPQPTGEDIRRMIIKANKALNSYGVTSSQTDDFCVFDGISPETIIDVYKELAAEGLQTVRVYEQSNITTVEELADFIGKGYVTGVGDEFFKVGPLKLLGDGSLGARTAFMREDYADLPGERGLAIFTERELEDLIGYAHSHGMQVAVHAIGDAILDRILNAFEKAFAACPRKDHRSGIVHVQITNPDQLERMRRLNLHAYVQTIFIDYDCHIVEARVGKEKAKTSYAFRTMREMGMRVSNGTDCPVEKPNALRGIQCAVTRSSIADHVGPYRPEEAMTVEEALQTYTSEGAFASFEENVKGKIAAGMLADFVELSADPFEVPADRIGGIVPIKTYLGGKCVYNASRE